MESHRQLVQKPIFVGNYSNPLLIPQNPTTVQVNYYCSNVLNYIRTCIQGPDIITYCNTGGLLCEVNHEPYLLNDIWVQCNTTSVNLCPERYYCPNANTMIGCPKGHFCREGKFSVPIKCLAATILEKEIDCILYLSFSRDWRFNNPTHVCLLHSCLPKWNDGKSNDLH